jgi:hypothetical protein
MPEASEASKTTEPEFSSSVANFPLLHKNLRRADLTARLGEIRGGFFVAVGTLNRAALLRRFGTLADRKRVA